MNCPYCQESIPNAAMVCPRCQRDLIFFRPIFQRIGELEQEIRDMVVRVLKLESQLEQAPLNLLGAQAGGTGTRFGVRNQLLVGSIAVAIQALLGGTVGTCVGLEATDSITETLILVMLAAPLLSGI